MDSRIYISGKITGLTREEYLARFAKVHHNLKMHGYDVYNPALINDTLPTCTNWEEYMEISMCLLKMCKRIYMLDGWETSRGAMIEHQYAKDNGYKIIYEALL